MEATTVASPYSGSFCDLIASLCCRRTKRRPPAASRLALTLGQSVHRYREVWSLNTAPSWRTTVFHLVNNKLTAIHRLTDSYLAPRKITVPEPFFFLSCHICNGVGWLLLAPFWGVLVCSASWATSLWLWWCGVDKEIKQTIGMLIALKDVGKWTRKSLSSVV